MKKKVLRKTKVLTARPDFTTSRGGSGFLISNNPLSGGGGG